MTDAQLFKIRLLLLNPKPPEDWLEVLTELIDVAAVKLRARRKIRDLETTLALERIVIKELKAEVARLTLKDCAACNGTGKERPK